MNLAETCDTIDTLYGSPFHIVSDCLRGFLTAAPGKDLISADFSAIEARVLAWLAGEEYVLELFRSGGLVYHDAASKIFSVPIESIIKNSKQYMVGKVSILALGYQGGVGAFHQMCKTYELKGISDKFANEIKIRFRESRPRTVDLWKDTEEAAMSAVLNPGQKFSVGAPGRQCHYMVRGCWLWCKLPSGGMIPYPYPEIQEVETPWGQLKDAVTYMGVKTKQGNKKWERQKSYGGHLVENNTQAVARDCLAPAMIRVEEAGYPIVLHVHDECVSEVDEGYGSVEEYENLLAIQPSWAVGLPISAEGWRGKRYRK